MLYRGRNICDNNLRAIDGVVGKIQDIYFDDQSWSVRYLVVDTGSWLNRGQILISPQALRGVSRAPDEFSTALTRRDVEDCPRPESHLPVSRQYEKRLHKHYAWEPYWLNPRDTRGGMYAFPGNKKPSSMQSEESVEDRAMRNEMQNQVDAHLRSLKEICKYGIHATDGSIGEITDLLIDNDTWRVTHLVAVTKTWFPDKHVVIDKGVVHHISVFDRSVSVNMTREDVRLSPEYHYEMTIDEAYQKDISAYFERLARGSEHFRARPQDHVDDRSTQGHEL